MDNDNVIIAKASIELIDNNDDLREVWKAMKKKWDENTKTIGVVLTGEYEGSKYRVSPSYINHN